MKLGSRIKASFTIAEELRGCWRSTELWCYDLHGSIKTKKAITLIHCSKQAIMSTQFKLKNCDVVENKDIFRQYILLARKVISNYILLLFPEIQTN